MTTEQAFLQLIRAEIKGGEFTCDPQEIDFDKLLSLAKAHDLAQLVCDALIKNRLITRGHPLYDRCYQSVMSAVMRETKFTYVSDIIARCLSAGGIDFIPMKGTIIRQIYPESWMRTSCDIDVLIHRCDLEKALDILKRNGFAAEDKINYHDVHLHYDGVNIELHFSICEHMESIDGVLCRVWDYARKDNGTQYLETPEFFMFHHIAHMSYHFLRGGCGVRPLIDLFLLNQVFACDRAALDNLLSESQLLVFHKELCRLIDIWFGDKEYTPLCLAMEAYILRGGVYGTTGNMLTASSAKEQNRYMYLLRRIFPGKDIIYLIYPGCKKCPWLLPFCYIHRIFSKAFRRNTQALKELNYVMGKDAGEMQDVRQMLTELGLR